MTDKHMSEAREKEIQSFGWSKPWDRKPSEETTLEDRKAIRDMKAEIDLLRKELKERDAIIEEYIAKDNMSGATISKLRKEKADLETINAEKEKCITIQLARIAELEAEVKRKDNDCVNIKDGLCTHPYGQNSKCACVVDQTPWKKCQGYAPAPEPSCTYPAEQTVTLCADQTWCKDKPCDECDHLVYYCDKQAPEPKAKRISKPECAKCDYSPCGYIYGYDYPGFRSKPQEKADLEAGNKNLCKLVNEQMDKKIDFLKRAKKAEARIAELEAEVKRYKETQLKGLYYREDAPDLEPNMKLTNIEDDKPPELTGHYTYFGRYEISIGDLLGWLWDKYQYNKKHTTLNPEPKLTPFGDGEYTDMPVSEKLKLQEKLSEKCQTCNGEGGTWDDGGDWNGPCPDCHGTGKAPKPDKKVR